MLRKLALAAVLGGLAELAASPAAADSKSLTMCWAAWDPANALVELDKDAVHGQVPRTWSQSRRFELPSQLAVDSENLRASRVRQRV